jgi:hypothetical protein
MMISSWGPARRAAARELRKLEFGIRHDDPSQLDSDERLSELT